MQWSDASNKSSFDEYEAMSTMGPCSPSSRLILDQGRIKKATWYHHLISWWSGTLEAENRAVIANFKNVLKEKYGDELLILLFRGMRSTQEA